MGKLLLAFIFIPAVELILLLKVGSLIGFWATAGIILGTGVLGAALARHQGLGVMLQLQREMQAGRLPAVTIVDGVIVLIAGALLLTPGFLTDLIGFLCLIPFSRRVIKKYLWSRAQRAIERGNVNIYVSGGRL